MKEHSLHHIVSIFVCTRDRGKKDDCCARSGSEKVLSQLKKRIKERKLEDTVRVYASGCIDKCAKGPNVLMFPGNVWASKVGGSDVDAILDAAEAQIAAAEEGG